MQIAVSANYCNNGTRRKSVSSHNCVCIYVSSLEHNWCGNTRHSTEYPLQKIQSRNHTHHLLMTSEPLTWIWASLKSRFVIQLRLDPHTTSVPPARIHNKFRKKVSLPPKKTIVIHMPYFLSLKKYKITIIIILL